jgi:hypothetical protein
MALAPENPLDAQARDDQILIEVDAEYRSSTDAPVAPVARQNDNAPRELVRYLPGCVNPVGTSVCDPTPCPDGTIRSTPISVTVPAGAAPPPLGAWTYSAPGCFPADADTGPVLTDAVIAESFRGLVTPSGAFIQPATGEALVNLRRTASAARLVAPAQLYGTA